MKTKNEHGEQRMLLPEEARALAAALVFAASEAERPR